MSEKDDKYMYEINKLEGERDSLRREVERLKEVDRLRSEDDETSETEWRSLVYVLVDAAGVTRGTSIPEDVAHTKAAIERLRAIVERVRSYVSHCPIDLKTPKEIQTDVLDLTEAAREAEE